jgi:hypothetical protein
MFAFALWDERRRSLFLARDCFGIKPLYYAWDGRVFLFGSELKAILQHTSIRRDVDPLALDDYFTFNYIPEPRSIFSAIRKLLPAHCLLVSTAGLVEREYWDLAFEPEAIDEDACAALAFFTDDHLYLVSASPDARFDKIQHPIDAAEIIDRNLVQLDRHAEFHFRPHDQAHDSGRIENTALRNNVVVAERIGSATQLSCELRNSSADALPGYFTFQVTSGLCQENSSGTASCRRMSAASAPVSKR